MAFGENPRHSPMACIEGVTFPATRDHLVLVAAEAEADVDVINIFKSLPKDEYVSEEDILRDLSEAARRFGMSNFAADEDGATRDRRDIGKEAVEGAPEGMTRHP